MAQRITLDPQRLEAVQQGDPRMVSYNVEMTEITGGTFWRPYTPAQIAGTEAFEPLKNLEDFSSMMAVFPPIDLTDQKLRLLAKALGPAWVRVSGSWATKTYYDLDGHTGGRPPEGFESVLTRAQWEGVMDFVKAIGARLMISVANCIGVHGPDGTWRPDQAQVIFDYSRQYGVPIEAAEFMNEPNSMAISGAPAGYTPADFARDQDIFFRFMRSNYPEVMLVGPCATGDAGIGESVTDRSNPLLAAMQSIPTEQLLAECSEAPDVFSYHYYNGISERGAALSGHWPDSQATCEEYLSIAGHTVQYYIPLRDSYCPGAPMWVTESGDAGCGGNTWASTYLDVIRFANELGAFSCAASGVIFHNTLCSSDYGLLAHSSYEPRPNYWLAVLWNRLMGTTAYAVDEPIREGVHLYAHDRADGKPGATYMLVNNSRTEATEVMLPAAARVYLLSAPELRSPVMELNGQPLVLTRGALPVLDPMQVEAGIFTVPPATVTFFVLDAG